MQYDVVIAGAGPAGCCAAEHLAEKGFKVLVLEEHKNIGEPVQCAGLISPRTLRLAGVSEKVVINRLTGVRVRSPLGARLDICSDRVHALAVDRAAFDRQLALRARDAGAVLYTGCRVRGVERIPGGYRVAAGESGAERIFEARLLIGADGANSRVAKWLGLDHNASRAAMYAADVKLRCADTGLVDIFMGRKLAPGWFGWVIPLDEKTCRVGTGYAFLHKMHSPRYYFQHIVNQFPNYFKDMKIIRYTGGIVPMGLKPRIYAPHAMLVGDAACQTKPISGGGIYLGLRAAQMCAEVAARALREDNCSEKKLARYQMLWEEEFGDEIRCGISHRESFLNFTDEDIDQLLRFLNKPYWQKIILKHGDIDYPSWLAKPLFSAGPWMQRFVKAALGMAGYGASLKNSLKNVFS
jgi:geranylgeranyl reductase family protein